MPDRPASIAPAGMGTGEEADWRRPDVIRDSAHPRAWMITNGGTEQSWVDPEDPLHLEFDYVQRLADGLDSFAPPGQRLRVVHIGGAGLSLPRYVTATRPTSAQIVFEPDADLTRRVREAIPLPRHSGIKVRDTDGRSGIAGLRDDYAEVIVVDAFAGPHVPAELTTAEFLADAHRVLTADGLFMINLTDRGPFDYGRRVAAGLVRTFANVAFSAEPSTLKGRRFGNVVIYAGDRALPITDLQQAIARGPFPYRLVTGAGLSRLIAGAPPFTDADSAASPDPRRGRIGW